MGHAVHRILADVEDEPVSALVHPRETRDLLGGEEEGLEHCSVARRQGVGVVDVPAWNDEHVHRGGWGDVSEGDDLVGLEHPIRRQLARHDLAEDAVHGSILLHREDGCAR